jgi:hypothetical protein
VGGGYVQSLRDRFNGYGELKAPLSIPTIKTIGIKKARDALASSKFRLSPLTVPMWQRRG